VKLRDLHGAQRKITRLRAEQKQKEDIEWKWTNGETDAALQVMPY